MVPLLKRLEKQAPETPEEWRALLLSFVGSLTLCDHQGDVADDIRELLDRIGWKGEWDDLGELGSALGRQGVQTLGGTSLEDED